jgi:predicted nucleic acid-binding protein
MDRVYLDTSFFVGLLENQENRQETARKILEYERGNDRFTSQLTLNEFMVRVYDEYKHSADCEDKVAAAELKIRSIARVVAISDDISKRAALLQSTFGEIHKQAPPPKEPRDRKFRWDAIHIATAWDRKCDRIYAWDGKWEKLPSQLKEGLGEILAPARLPGLLGLLSQTTEEGPAPPQPPVEEGQAPTFDPSTEPEPPSSQSLAAVQESTSRPEPSPLLDLPGAQVPQQQPEGGPPATPPLPPAVPPSPSE